MPGLSHNSMAAILKLAYRCDAYHNFVSFVVYDGVNLSNRRWKKQGEDNASWLERFETTHRKINY